ENWEETIMHARKFLVLAGTAGLISTCLVPDRADAIGLPGTQSVLAAIEAVDIGHRAHCRPGWWHHGYRPHDGCYRVYRRYYTQPVYSAPYYYYGGPGVAVYGRGIPFGFGFGPHRRWGW